MANRSSVAHALVRAVFALLRTRDMEEPRSTRSHERERGTHGCVRHVSMGYAPRFVARFADTPPPTPTELRVQASRGFGIWRCSFRARAASIPTMGGVRKLRGRAIPNSPRSG